MVKMRHFLQTMVWFRVVLEGGGCLGELWIPAYAGMTTWGAGDDGFGLELFWEAEAVRENSGFPLTRE